MADLSPHERVDHNLTTHPIPTSVEGGVEGIRALAKQLGHNIIEWCPASREQSLALTHLEETVMWAVAAIARN